MSAPPQKLTPAVIRGALAERGILKYEFAHRVGMHPQTLGALLNGRRELTEAVAARILAALREDDERRAE